MQWYSAPQYYPFPFRPHLYSQTTSPTFQSHFKHLQSSQSLEDQIYRISIANFMFPAWNNFPSFCSINNCLCIVSNVLSGNIRAYEVLNNSPNQRDLRDLCTLRISISSPWCKLAGSAIFSISPEMYKTESSHNEKSMQLSPFEVNHPLQLQQTSLAPSSNKGESSLATLFPALYQNGPYRLISSKHSCSCALSLSYWPSVHSPLFPASGESKHSSV